MSTVVPRNVKKSANPLLDSIRVFFTSPETGASLKLAAVAEERSKNRQAAYARLSVLLAVPATDTSNSERLLNAIDVHEQVPTGGRDAVYHEVFQVLIRAVANEIFKELNSLSKDKRQDRTATQNALLRQVDANKSGSVRRFRISDEARSRINLVVVEAVAIKNAQKAEAKLSTLARASADSSQEELMEEIRRRGTADRGDSGFRHQFVSDLRANHSNAAFFEAFLKLIEDNKGDPVTLRELLIMASCGIADFGTQTPEAQILGKARTAHRHPMNTGSRDNFNFIVFADLLVAFKRYVGFLPGVEEILVTNARTAIMKAYEAAHGEEVDAAEAKALAAKAPTAQSAASAAAASVQDRLRVRVVDGVEHDNVPPISPLAASNTSASNTIAGSNAVSNSPRVASAPSATYGAPPGVLKAPTAQVGLAGPTQPQGRVQ